MSYKNLGDPFYADTTLHRQTSYGCVDRQVAQVAPEARATTADIRLQPITSTDYNPLKTSQDVIDRVIEGAILRSVFGHHDAG